MKDVDVAIVGGGLSGLYLAYCLQKLNKSYVLLEAKGVFGGRIYTKVSMDDGFGMDLGPTWFWPQQNRLLSLLSELKLEFFEQYQKGDSLYQTSGRAPQRFSDMEGMRSFRLQGGVYHLIEALKSHLDPNILHLSHAVKKIEGNNEGWKLHTANKTFSAKHIALAVPPRISLARIEGLTSYLSESLQKTLVSTPTWMAAQAKFVAQYKTPFWREAGLAGGAFSHVGPMVEIHDASSHSGSGYGLFGFVGLSAEARQSYPRERMESLCLKQLAILFGERAFDTQMHCLKDWALDAWVSTKQDVSECSRHPECNLKPHLSELKKLNISFPITECAHYDAGLLEGAIAASDTALSQLASN